MLNDTSSDCPNNEFRRMVFNVISMGKYTTDVYHLTSMGSSLLSTNNDGMMHDIGGFVVAMASYK